MAITLHSKTKTFDEGFGKAFKYLPQTGFLFVGCKSITIFLFLISLTLLLRAGDIETNPGPVLTYNESIKMTLRRESGIKIYHLNVQSILSQKEQLRTLVHDLCPNCNFCFTETWLCEFDDINVFNPEKERYCCFRSDRISPAGMKTKNGGGVMKLVPKVFSPKIRNDLNLFTRNFESVWVSLKIPTCSSLLVNVIYNPNKQNSTDFLDKLAINIDNAITKNEKIILLGDYNINYLDTLERSRLETEILPYDLHIENQTIPTRLNRGNNTKSLIDYIITDSSTINDTIICDSIVKSDHFATLILLGLHVETKKVPVQKKFFDKKNYNALDFKHCLEQQNWQKMYVQNSLDSMLQVFTENFTTALSKSAPLKKCFIRNDKIFFTLTDNWLTRKSRQLMVDRDRFLNDKDYENFFDLKNQFSTSNDNDFNRFHRNLIETAESDREKWMLINEVRNSEKNPESTV